MKLTRTERWILSNQYQILEALYPQEAKWYGQARTALENGYELQYGWLAEHIRPDEDVMTEEQCREVIDILDMFSTLKFAYEKLKDRTGIDEWRVKFAGFDGNHETKQMAYARYFCGLDGGRFQELDRGDDFNSHMPVLDRYRRMLAMWKSMKEKRDLTKEEILRIASAA